MDKENLRVGDKVYYDAYPHGDDIEGVVVIINKTKVINTIGEYKKLFTQIGVSNFIEIEDAQNIRLRK